jgi:hypothetical protein
MAVQATQQLVQQYMTEPKAVKIELDIGEPITDERVIAAIHADVQRIFDKSMEDGLGAELKSTIDQHHAEMDKSYKAFFEEWHETANWTASNGKFGRFFINDVKMFFYPFVWFGQQIVRLVRSVASTLPLM